jgi:predicted RNA binding protein YcfA (HicA-like mRNA interferase family)
VSHWPSSKPKKVYKALLAIGWEEKPNQKAGSSHVKLVRAGWREFIWAFHEGDEIGPKMLSRISKQTGLKPSDL